MFESIKQRMKSQSDSPEEGVKYPGKRGAMDGNSAVISCERESSDAAGAYPITPSTQMGEMWAEAAAQGHINISERPLIFIEPEGEHAAAAVTAGLSMTGLRSANFSSGQGIAYMHESLYAAVGKRLTYVLNIGARAMTKATLNVHAGHDDYHCIDDTGFFQMFAANAQQAADLNIIAHRIAEMALTPGAIAQDGFLTTHLIESLLVPERELIEEFLGRPDDIIDTPTPAQRIIYGDTRRRIPELWDVDNPVMSGLVQNQDSYMQSVAAQRPFFFDHIKDITDAAFEEFHQLTGRHYQRVTTYKAEDAEYLILGQGSMTSSAQVVADYLRETRQLKVGVVNLLMFRPFPSDLLGTILKGKKGVVVLERLDQPLASELPIMREVRSTLGQCLENGRANGELPYPELCAYSSLDDLPELYSGAYGLGSRDLQPEGLIGAIENMLAGGAKRKRFYLSVDFLHEQARTPKQEIYQQTLEEAYPDLRKLSVRGSENPNLMPDESITMRFHSIGGWGAITTGKNLAMTLFELLGFHVKANPKYGSEKKGQPTTYYLSVAPEPVRINCEYIYVDVVLSPDPNVLHHTNALAGLKDGGVFIIQSEKKDPEQVWQDIPAHYQKIIQDKNIQLYYLDAFRIAREEATDPELQLRMQGIAFQGAFFAASGVMNQHDLTEESLLEAIRKQLQHKFGEKGARVVEENIKVVRRGFDEVRALDIQKAGVQTLHLVDASDMAAQEEPGLPVVLKNLPESKAPKTDIHRFWAQTGSFYAQGQGNDNLCDPFISLGVMPASTALFRDMSGIRFNHPQWNAENCTACGNCYTVCPDTAIPGLVTELGGLFETLVKRIKRSGHQTMYLQKAVRKLEQVLKPKLQSANTNESFAFLLDESLKDVLHSMSPDVSEPEVFQEEIGLLKESLEDYQFALTRPYYTLPEKQKSGEGALFSIAINPYTCKGCMECIEVCDDNALFATPQTLASEKKLKDQWSLWMDLPNTPKRYQRVENLEEGIGALETILLDKEAYQGLSSGDGACLGCSEKTVVHLFVATVESLMRPRVAKHVAYLSELITRLEGHVQKQLVQEVNVDDTDAMLQAMQPDEHGDLTLSDMVAKLESKRGVSPIDPQWLQRNLKLIAALKKLRHQYTEGTTGRGRSNMGMLNATGCTSVWGSTYPYNPYPFPWSNHLFQDPASVALGVFEGHMAKMAEGFASIRKAELELAGEYRRGQHEDFFKNFSWQQFSDEEFDLCPPVVTVGGDGAMYDIGFQNLSRLMMTGKPIKVLVVDTQVYSNTGGQACTSGFIGEVSDMAPFGKANPGKQEPRKEIGLVAMAHRTTYVMQSTIAHANHMIEGFVEGLRTRRPALFNLYTSCQPEHGIGDDMGHHQAKLAVESRAYPIFRYNPDKGVLPEDCFDLDGNPAIHDIWPHYQLDYVEGGQEKTMELPLTFADFAMTEGRFRKHFRSAAPDTWHDNMSPLADYLELEADERAELVPFIWTVNKKGHLSRLLVDETMVASCEDRRNFWSMLKAIARIEKPQGADATDNSAQIRQQIVGNLVEGLMKLAQNPTEALAALNSQAASDSGAAPAQSEAVVPLAQAEPSAPAANNSGDYMAPWIDSDECTACDECTQLNGQIFAYNENKKAYITNPDGGPYRDLVKAAEKCTAQVIHPGLPKDRSEKDIEKWIKRAEKFNAM